MVAVISGPRGPRRGERETRRKKAKVCRETPDGRWDPGEERGNCTVGMAGWASALIGVVPRSGERTDDLSPAVSSCLLKQVDPSHC